MSTTLGIDPASTLSRSCWVLTQHGQPVASGKCNALPNVANVTSVIIESITALPNEKGRRTIWLRAGTNGSTIIPVARTEGRLMGHLLALYPSLPVYGVPRSVIIYDVLHRSQQLLATKPKALDSAIRSFCLTATSPAHLRPRALLSTTDLRDAYLAALARPDPVWRIM